MRNITLAARMLLKTPFVTTIAVLSLALGIGANAAIFSMFDELLLHPLSVPDPTRLVNLSAPGPMPGYTQCNNAGPCDVIFSYPMFRDLEKGQTPFTGIAGHQIRSLSLAVRNEPMTARGILVSGSYFPVLQLHAEAGRLLTPDDDKVLGANFVAVISDRFWEEKFGRDQKAIGQSLIVNGKAYSIVGVAPAGFEGTTAGTRAAVFLPISMRGELERFTHWEDRRAYWVYVFARLKPGMSADAARAAINATYHPILTDVEASLQEAMSEQRLVEFKNKKLLLAPGARGQSSVDREARTPILLLFSVTGVVLLIACANIANLLLARGAGRATEMGVRLALGATRRHLVLQLLTESLLLAIVGGIASLFVAQWTLSFIMSILPPDASDTLHFSLNATVILFAAGLSVVTGLAFGLFPALHSTRSDLISTIRAGAGQIAGGRSAARFRASLVTAQIALSTGLLIMSALFLKSLMNVSRTDLGFQLDHVSTFAIEPSQVGYDSTRSAVLFNRVEQELAALPGVTGVTDGLVPILAGDNWGTDVKVQGYTCGADENCGSSFNETGIDYFKTLGVRMKSGREFTASDRLGSQKVAVVNEAFVRRYRLGPDAVGKFITDDVKRDTMDTQIVGVVTDVKYSQVKDTARAVLYKPWRQDARAGGMVFYVKSTLPPEQMLGTLRTTMNRIDPTLPVQELRTMPQQIRQNVFLDRMISILSSGFALLATLLAGIGLYGVLSYSVQQRTREIGVRMALGADAARVRSMVMRQVGLMLLGGGVVGVAAALGLGRAAQSLLYQLEGHDPIAFAMAVVLLSVVALSAGWLPARRAAGVDPMQALRYD